jgi:hypothetical protein
MKYYIDFGNKFPIGMYPLTERQQNHLLSINFIKLDMGNVYRKTDGISYDDIARALYGISHD